MKRKLYYYLTIVCLWALPSCSEVIKEPSSAILLQEWPDIFPDYLHVTIPSQIAPMCFMLAHDAEEAIACFSFGEHQLICRQDNKKGFLPNEDEWHKLLHEAIGEKIEIKIYERKGKEWVMYHPFHFEISQDSIDSYLVYRLIEPGYELWNQMGIYQRDLNTFEQTVIIPNKQTGYNCINCHSFANQQPDKMLFHMRGIAGGTYIINDKQIIKLDGKINEQIQSLVYPSWHPSGNFVAFSTNLTRQAFHMNDKNRIEVFDYTSDILIYDVLKNEAFTVPSLFAQDAFETFPSFSPDGKTLYFCSAEAKDMPEDFQQVKYNLCSITFDPETRSFGETVDTLYHTNKKGQSASFPRVSPDGTFLAFTLSEYGNFSIWHKEADLYLIRLKDRSTFPLDTANSNDVESYHSWSSNGRWMVFSSRRIDGLYTHPYLVHIDKDGTATKPFVLPQKQADFYRSFMQSFNIPEFIKKKVKISRKDITWEPEEGYGEKITFTHEKE